jgi:hypothetical protein
MMRGGEKFAHQHVETTVPAQRHDLARTVERLDAVGLTKRGAHGAIGTFVGTTVGISFYRRHQNSKPTTAN